MAHHHLSGFLDLSQSLSSREMSAASPRGGVSRRVTMTPNPRDGPDDVTQTGAVLLGETSADADVLRVRDQHEIATAARAGR